jgi:hypothetical protein
MKKRYKKHMFIFDRIPYILFAFILIVALIVFFSLRSCTSFDLFSGEQQTEEEVDYSLLIASPTNDNVFNFVNENETVPIEIKAAEVKSTDYIIKIMVNNTEIKSFTSPPYEYNWNPGSSGEYEMVAHIVDNNRNTIASSNTVNFSVQYEIEPEGETTISVDIEEKKNQVLNNSVFRTNNTIPTGVPLFSYKCYTPPVIDASIQEWNKFESFSDFVPTIKKENYTSSNDISGTFYSCWDDDNFFLAVQVIDDVFSQNYVGNQINKGDSISIVFDTELEEDMQIKFYNSDDYEIRLSPGSFSGTLAESFISWPSNAAPGGATINSTRLVNGYILEASIPWYNFTNYKPADGDVLGFTVSILDTDNLESTELVISSSKTFDFNNVSTLGAIALIDVGDIQGTGEEPDAEESAED